MKIRILTMVAVAALLAAACQAPSVPSSAPKASLTINVSNQINARTLAPTIDMNPGSYTVTGTGPAGASFTATTSGGSVTQSNLAFGSWTVAVNATNAGGTLIGTGSATTQVNTASTSTVAVTVTPVSGVGTLSLGVSWPSGSVQTPSIDSTLTPALGSAQNLSFNVSGNSASYSNTSVGNGYYTLALQVKDTGIVVAGAVDVVRIVTGESTSGTYAFSQVNAPGGAIQVNVDANMQNPLEVSISGASATQTVGTTKTLSASVSDYAGNVVYVWYVNGVSAGAGSTFDFSSGSVPGYSYRIDVTAFSADGTRGGSATATVGAVAGVVLPSSFINYTSNGLGSSYVLGVAASGSTLCAATFGGLSVSNNGGSSWTNYTTADGLGVDLIYCVAVSGSTIYAGTWGGGLAVSRNGGDSWTTYVGGAVFSLAVSGSSIYAGTASGGLWVSNNDGSSWTSYSMSDGLGSNQVMGVAVSGSNIYVGTFEGGLAVSTNGGSSWANYTTANGLGDNTVVSVAVSGSTIYAGTLQGLSVSTDGGASWTNYTTANGLGANYIAGVTVSGSTIYASTYGGGLSVSVDGGAHWTTYTTSDGLGADAINNVALSGSTVYAATNGGLSVSQ